MPYSNISHGTECKKSVKSRNLVTIFDDVCSAFAGVSFTIYMREIHWALKHFPV